MFIRIARAIGYFIIGSFFVAVAGATAQDSAITGYWQQKGEAIVLELKEVDGSLEGVIVRNDWSPGLVNMTFVRNATYDSDSEAWVGEIFDSKSNEYREGEITASNGESMRIKVKGRRRISWIKTESMQELQ